MNSIIKRISQKTTEIDRYSRENRIPKRPKGDHRLRVGSSEGARAFSGTLVFLGTLLYN